MQGVDIPLPLMNPVHFKQYPIRRWVRAMVPALDANLAVVEAAPSYIFDPLPKTTGRDSD